MITHQDLGKLSSVNSQYKVQPDLTSLQDARMLHKASRSQQKFKTANELKSNPSQDALSKGDKKALLGLKINDLHKHLYDMNESLLSNEDKLKQSS